jgi:hypothetical protein
MPFADEAIFQQCLFHNHRLKGKRLETAYGSNELKSQNIIGTDPFGVDNLFAEAKSMSVLRGLE